ncbi:TPA: DUF924 family protein [Aeromonas hydrophila]|uniref:DUF924 family protein n=1 Tax=Aeromonas hydrophila TaxID=644 RepID=UPI000FD16034|nr:DUF924 family protein [Aeromonas hydrophila]AZU48428.1 hypothetical protein C3B79_2670 [Aeromonas hydrophila]MCV3295126.1 DUF924 domain-containing protein [Aeromonas hydrophila]QBX71051.1 DUF924 domain-containing protein [Aeromonas hydrophila]QBX75777.1 DUF924 domain-containing protein [Aeromonas hydrophila]WDA26187.1 DUF924 domain-containing protein [Aeromonas hydrophila]
MQPWQPLITFWFGEETDDVARAKRQAPLWWGKNSDTDALLASRFGDLVVAAAAGELAHWADSAEGRLALILLLDQLPRNIHRGTPAAFTQDAKARDLCLKGLSLGADLALPPLGRVFFYLPLEHAESREQQARSVALFEGLVAEQADGPARESFAGFADFARRHQVIVERFGRFPHRNAILGRQDTAEEAAFLLQPGSGF